MRKISLFAAMLFSFVVSSFGQQNDRDVPFIWENANVYFLLTDRFLDGDPSNNFSYGRQQDGATLRSFEGGDLAGITQRISEGYFSDLGVSAIWLTPPVEQIRGFTDEGTGKTYAYHGYWARDWTTIDQNYGSMAEFKAMVDSAHARGIRVVMDIVLNHVGPENPLDQPNWPSDWVRVDPTCTYNSRANTQECTLVDNLPDIFTESESAVNLPQWLLDKWNAEGRLQQELDELDAFFLRTGYPRAPKYYIIKWLTDFVRELGIDGFRVDTAKHVDAPDAWPQLKAEGVLALREWKQNHPAEKLDDLDFWMTGEVFDYGSSMGRTFTGNGFSMDYFSNGFDNLIDFDFKDLAKTSGLEQLFSIYSGRLQNELSGVSVLNYISNHDVNASQLFDGNRTRSFEGGTKLLLTPGASQIYYGDETNRTLTAAANGDASLRSNMNWGNLDPSNTSADAILSRDVLTHWQKLGRFRREHVSVGAGVHSKLQDFPYAFKREYTNALNPSLNDKVVVYDGIPSDPQPNTVSVFGVFANGTELLDYFSGTTATVQGGNVTFDTPFGTLLIGEPFDPSQPPPACAFPSLNVRGTFNGFGNLPMTCDGSNVWSAEATFVTDPNNRFKFDVLGDWSNNFGDNEGDGIGDSFGADIPISSPGTYSITFNDQTLAYTVTCLSGDCASTSSCDFPSLNVRGTFNGFQNEPMTCSGNNVWTAQVTFVSDPNNRFKFDKFGDWSDNFGDNNQDGVAESFGADIPISTPGTYDITFNDQTLAYTATCVANCGSSNLTLRFFKPSNWNDAYIYLFDASTSTTLAGFNGWPGQAMTAIGNDWYEFSFDPGGANVGIVFNENVSGGNQTADLFRSTDGWYNGSWSDNCPANCPSGSRPAPSNDVPAQLDQGGAISTLIYPNPATDQFTIRPGGKYEQLEVSLLQLDGKEVYHRFFTAYQDQVSVGIAQLDAGIYILSVWADGALISQSKIVK